MLESLCKGFVNFSVCSTKVNLRRIGRKTPGNACLFSTVVVSHPENTVSQTRIQVGDNLINYASVGSGNHAVLCLPGIFGTITTDFEQILQRVDPNKFTLICWDPPGTGNSNPLERETIYHGNPFANEADIATDLMRILDIPFYSIMGWDYGGITGAHIAATYRKHVDKFICWGSWAQIDTKVLERTTRLPENLTPRWRNLTDMYGENYARSHLTQWTAYAQKCIDFGYFRLDLLLPAIKAQTLVLHGKKDTVCSQEDAEMYAKLIPKSRLETWDDANHDLHLEEPEKFVRRVEEFLTEGL